MRCLRIDVTETTSTDIQSAQGPARTYEVQLKNYAAIPKSIIACDFIDWASRPGVGRFRFRFLLSPHFWDCRHSSGPPARLARSDTPCRFWRAGSMGRFQRRWREGRFTFPERERRW